MQFSHNNMEPGRGEGSRNSDGRPSWGDIVSFDREPWERGSPVFPSIPTQSGISITLNWWAGEGHAFCKQNCFVLVFNPFCKYFPLFGVLNSFMLNATADMVEFKSNTCYLLSVCLISILSMFLFLSFLLNLSSFTNYY